MPGIYDGLTNGRVSLLKDARNFFRGERRAEKGQEGETTPTPTTTPAPPASAGLGAEMRYAVDSAGERLPGGAEARAQGRALKVPRGAEYLLLSTLRPARPAPQAPPGTSSGN